MSLAIHIHPADNVAVALQPIAKGTAVALPDLGLTVVAAGDIPQGHKLAVRPIAAGENVLISAPTGTGQSSRCSAGRSVTKSAPKSRPSGRALRVSWCRALPALRCR